MCVTLFCLVYPFFLFLHVCCFINVALSSSALLSFVGACFAFSCWCCRLDERLGKGGGGGGQDDEERLFASDAGSWYTVSDVDCSEDSSDDGNDDVDDDSTTSVDGSDDDEEDDDDDDRFTLQRCRRRVRNVIVSDTDSDNSGA